MRSHVEDFLSGFTNPEIVSALYRAILRREPDESGLENYLTKLSGHDFRELERVVAGLINSGGKRGRFPGYAAAILTRSGSGAMEGAPGMARRSPK